MKSQNICNHIRLIIKEKEYTQEEFSKVIGVSLPTLNRWLRGEGLLFEDLTLMLEKLNIKLSELAIISESKMTHKFTYTLQQEEALVSTEGLLAFFDQLINGKTVSSIVKTHKLSDKSVNFYLSKLNKLKLIEWLPNNKVKILATGEPSWIVGGPLSQKFRKQIINGHVQNYLNNNEMLKVGVYNLSATSSKKINEKMQELLESVRLLELKDKNSERIQKLTTVILGCGINDIPLLSKIPQR